jgi:hypothetical protein
LCLQLPILAPKLIDLLLQRGEASDGLSMHALPVASLLSEFEIVTPQSSHFGTQRSNFLAELRDQSCQRRALIDIRHGIEEESFHDLLVLESGGRRWTEQLEQNAENRTAWTKLYRRQITGREKQDSPRQEGLIPIGFTRRILVAYRSVSLFCIYPSLLSAPMIEDQLVESLEQNRIAEEQQRPEVHGVLFPALYNVLVNAACVFFAKDDARPLALASSLGTAQEAKEPFARLPLRADVDSTLRLVLDYRDHIQQW